VIANVISERGSTTFGLLKYLWGPGRFNEHENPRIVAAWDPTFVRGIEEPEFDEFELRLLAREMEAPLRLQNIPLGDHVYHVPVAVSPKDGELTDEQWAQVAYEAAEKLGFTDGPSRSAVAWFAMRHGLGKEGHDAIHFVAVLRRESGEKVVPWNDYKAWEEVRHAAEDRWGLVSTRRRGGGIPDLSRAEIERAEREGRSEPERVELARLVRAAATAARSEGEFLTRLRRQGVIVRARWKTGGQDTVEGYSVALRPPTGAERRPIWFGGGRLADDLTLPELRARWEQPTDEQAADTRRAWRPRGWTDLPTGRQVAITKLRAEAWQAATEKVAEVRSRLTNLDPNDQASWSAVASDASATLAALAARVELDRRGDLRRAANALARVAQTDRGTSRHRPDGLSAMAGVVRTATDAMLAAHGGPYAVAALIMQLGRLVQAIQHASHTAARTTQARRAAEAADAMLDYVRSTAATAPQTPADRTTEQSRTTPTTGARETVHRPGQTTRESDVRDR